MHCNDTLYKAFIPVLQKHLLFRRWFAGTHYNTKLTLTQWFPEEESNMLQTHRDSKSFIILFATLESVVVE